MHPYRLQALIKERGKDRVANVAQRNSVYQTIDGLRKAELVAVRESSRHKRRPERTVYEITELGRVTLAQWLRLTLSTPSRDYPNFPAALSLASLLSPDELRRELEARLSSLQARLAELEQPVPGLPRLFLLEAEYMTAVVRAELQWLSLVVDDLREGRLAWSEGSLRSATA